MKERTWLILSKEIKFRSIRYKVYSGRLEHSMLVISRLNNVGHRHDREFFFSDLSEKNF